MARLNIYNNIILTFECKPYVDIYWTRLSEYIIEKYGESEFTEGDEVENILLDSFQFLVNEFRELILEETSFSFFIYTFFLHEQSLEFLNKIRGGLSYGEVNENDFSIYRRILKLILEQGCENDLTWGSHPTGKLVFEMNDKIQRLYYIGGWIYTFADYIAYQKMIKDAQKVDFDSSHAIGVTWQKHYGKVYKEFFPLLKTDYENGVHDENGSYDLKQAINTCFNIEYDFAIGIIYMIKQHFSESMLQTIEPCILPVNLAQESGVDSKIAEIFYNGLILNRRNKLSIEDAILKPYSTERYMFRPILVYNIEGVERALVGENKMAESMHVLATNAISWNTIPKDWTYIKCMVKFMSRKGNEHDKILEDNVEEILQKHKFRFCRNIRSFKRPNQHNLNIDNHLAGEIDFIIVDDRLQKILVVESKYNKARYEAVGYRTDYTNFLNSYESQLLRKFNWICANKVILQEHLKIKYNISEYNILDFSVEGLFFINTPTFYMLNGVFKAITISKLEKYLIGEYSLPVVEYENEEGEITQYQHPYFK